MSGFRLALVAIGFITPVAAFAVADQGTTPGTAANQTAAAQLTLDTPIEQLVANERSRAVLAARLPGLTEHPSYNSFKGFSLRQLQPFSEGRITDEILRQIETDLAAIR